MAVFLLHGFVVVVFWAVTPVEAYTSEGVFLLLTGLLAVLIAFGLASVVRFLNLIGLNTSFFADFINDRKVPFTGPSRR